MHTGPAESPPVGVDSAWDMDLTQFTVPSYDSQQGSDKWKFQKTWSRSQVSLLWSNEKGKILVQSGGAFFFFFFNENGFHLEVRDAICLILVLDCRVLYYFVCAKSL